LTLAGWPGRGESAYLDLVAEAAWKFIVEPESERLGVERARTGEVKAFRPEMSLRREFELGGRPAREYAVRLEDEGGPVYVCAEGRRVYVVAALAPDPQAADSRRFVESFSLKSGEAARVGETAAASGVGPVPARDFPSLVKGTPPPPPAPPADPDAPVDYDKPFRQNELTRKATITFKPEPGFTEEARKFNVTGVVRLRAVLSKTGEVTNLNVVKYLPHGLTEKAVDAAKAIRFTPAQKDGRAVGQYVILEYNFNIY
jgi:TonB family protein